MIHFLDFDRVNKRINHTNQLNCLTQVRELVPESQAYMDLLAFERKLDSTIMRKRLDIQEALKRPMKQIHLGPIKRANETCPFGAS